MKNEATDDPTDLITCLGHLCMGSRLKRLGEQMQSGVAAILSRRGLAVQPAHLPVLVALEEKEGAMTVGALGARIGISQPGVTRALLRLEELGLVAPTSGGGGDRRERQMTLTSAGAALTRRLRTELFPAVEQAVEHLCRAASGDMLATVERIEAALREEPLDSRIERTGGPVNHG